MTGVVMVPWYATGFRGEGFEAALREIAPVAMRYGATSFSVYRARDDRYKFQHYSAWEQKLDWERYWEGPEMTEFRIRHSSWHQVPVLYGWWDLVAGGMLDGQAAAQPNGNDAAATREGESV